MRASASICVRALAVTDSNEEFVASVLQPSSVRHMLCCLTGADDKLELRDMPSSVHVVLTRGSAEAATAILLPTSVFANLLYFKLHPENKYHCVQS